MPSRDGVPAKYALVPVRGEKTRLRPLTRDDLPLIALWDRDPQITGLMGQKFSGFDGDPATWFRRVAEDRRLRALGIETLNGKLIGEVELDRIDWRARAGELRVVIGDRDYWGDGYGRDALSAFLRLAFLSWGLSTVYLRVYRHNLRAIRVYRRLGFVPVGVLPPSPRRGDPGEVLLMSLGRRRFLRSGSERQEV